MNSWKAGRFNEKYGLIIEYEEWPLGEKDEELTPEKGSDYWDGGGDIDSWMKNFTEHLNLPKLPLPSPWFEIEQIIVNEYINEKLLR